MKEVYLNQTQNLDKWNKQANTFTKPQYIIKKKKKNQNQKIRISEDQSFGFDYDWKKERKWTIDGDKGFFFFSIPRPPLPPHYINTSISL